MNSIINLQNNTKQQLHAQLKFISQDLVALVDNKMDYEYFELSFMKQKLQSEFIEIMHEMSSRKPNDMGMTNSDHAKCSAIWNRIERVEAKIEAMM